MDAVQLMLLGRKLQKLGEEALPNTGFARLPISARTVLSDVLAHPGSSISEITERTGLPQSLVSDAVARVRDGGGLVTETDPRDRRRTLVRPAGDVWRRARSVGRGTVEETLARALADDRQDELDEVLAALESLSERLTPRAAAKLRAGLAR